MAFIGLCIGGGIQLLWIILWCWAQLVGWMIASIINEYND